MELFSSVQGFFFSTKHAPASIFQPNLKSSAMVKFANRQEMDEFRKWLVDVLLVAAQSRADADVVSEVMAQARKYSLLAAAEN